MRNYQSFQLIVNNSLAELSASADVFVNNPARAVTMIDGLLDCAEVKPNHAPLRMITAISTALEANEGLIESFVYTVGCTEYHYAVKVLPYSEPFHVTRVIINVQLHRPTVKSDTTCGACYA